jgi:hypothetical protein
LPKPIEINLTESIAVTNSKVTKIFEQLSNHAKTRVVIERRAQEIVEAAPQFATGILDRLQRLIVETRYTFSVVNLDSVFSSELRHKDIKIDSNIATKVTDTSNVVCVMGENILDV